MKSLSYNHNKSKGFSLIELLLVLGVLAILMVAAFVVYPQVRDRNQANSEVSNLMAAKANLNNLYASTNGDYTGLTTGVANQARVFPSNMNAGKFTASATVSSSWSGGVTVLPSAAGTFPNGTAYTANHAFAITYAGVPAGVCLSLVSGAAANFQDVQVGGATVFKAAAAGGTFDPALAAAKCAAAPADVAFISN